MMYKGKIKIKLKSDLCIGSGYAYAGVIDSDVCYDGAGIPYIPGKRLKGCFRETANSYLHSLYDDVFINNLFGLRGQQTSGKITIGNAFVVGYDEISKTLKHKIEEDPQKYNQQSILEQYSRVIAQTKLTDSGSAEEGSLRYTRVVNHYTPGEGTELVFEASITADINDSEKEALANIVKATKNIGLKRNRGLGSVACEVLDLTEVKYDIPNLSPKGSEEQYIISYSVTNNDPLVLSGESSNESENYIQGSNVIGAMAGRYLSLKGASAEDEAFKDLFLNGKVKFTNLYPSVSGKEFYPAPEYINSMKTSKALVNVLDENEKNRIENITEENEETQKYSRRKGNQPKKLRGKFVSMDSDNKIATMEVDKEVIYHHSHYIDNSDGTQGLLYAMEVVSAGQTFAGCIIAPEKYKDLIIALLKQGDFYFGKSKTAQYGRCELSSEPKSEKLQVNKKNYNSGDRIVVTLRSDAIFMNNTGAYTVYIDDVSKILAKELGITDAENERDLTFVKTGKATGYMSVWNLRKPSIPVVKAGSAFVYTLKSSVELHEKTYIGERCIEGYGHIAISSLKDMHYKIEDADIIKQSHNDAIHPDGSAKAVCDGIENEFWLREKKLEFIRKKPIFKNSSGLGRVTLMLKESLASSQDYREQFKAFSDRVDSISENNNLKGDAMFVLKIFGKKTDDTWEFTWLDGENLPSNVLEKRRKYWGDCLMSALVVRKYELKEDK